MNADHDAELDDLRTALDRLAGRLAADELLIEALAELDARLARLGERARYTSGDELRLGPFVAASDDLDAAIAAVFDELQR